MGQFLVWILMAIWAVMGTGIGVVGQPQDHLVVGLPGQPKVDFKQFAGYVDVDEKAGKSLFYYFVESQKDSDKKPLTLWLNGGPGCSSIGGGAFTELGPFFPRGDGRGLRLNKHSWNKVSNLLFVESPAGVGWSYSNRTSDYTCGDKSTTSDMHIFLIRWFEKFPDFKTRDFFLTGESYAGHYIPELAVALLNHNKHSTNFKFNIRGVAIGNPLLKLDRDIPASYEYFWSHGMISDEIGSRIMKNCDFEDYTFTESHNVSNLCNDAIAEAYQVVGNYINQYDVILDLCYPSIVKQELRLKKNVAMFSIGVDVCMTMERDYYFNLPEVQHALHANRTSLPYNWSTCSELLCHHNAEIKMNSKNFTWFGSGFAYIHGEGSILLELANTSGTLVSHTGILNYNLNDASINILPLLRRIIRHRIPVWVFSGDQDSVAPFLGTRTLMRELAHDMRLGVSVPYTAWFYKGQVGGWMTEYGNILTFATVRGAAHMVPYAQPARAFFLYKLFVNGRRLPNTTFPPIDG